MAGAWLGVLGIVIGAVVVGVLTAGREHGTWLRSQRLLVYAELLDAMQDIMRAMELRHDNAAPEETTRSYKQATRDADAVRVRIELVGSPAASRAASDLTWHVLHDLHGILETVVTGSVDWEGDPIFEEWNRLESVFITAAVKDLQRLPWSRPGTFANRPATRSDSGSSAVES